MKKFTAVLLSAILAAGIGAAVQTPDLTAEEKEKVKNYTNKNLDNVPDHILSAVQDEKVDVVVDGKTYGLRFEDGELTKVYNEGFSDPTVKFTVSGEAAEQLRNSENPYSEALKLISQGEIQIDRSPEPVKEAVSSSQGSESSGESRTDSGSSPSSGSGGVISTVTQTVSDVTSSVASTVTGFF